MLLKYKIVGKRLLHHLLQGVRLQQFETAAVGVDEPFLLHGAQLPGKGAAVAVEVIRQLDAELVTVLASAGSTPRGAGAVLAVFPDGTGIGTVGGGNVEYEAQKLASKLLETGENALRDFRFVQGDAASLGMVCGGDVTLHFHYLDASDSHTAAVFRALLDATAGSADTWLVRKLDGAAVTAMGLADRTGTKYIENVPAGLLESRAAFREGWFALPAVRGGKVYIFGGGHVSQALVPAIAAVGFRPVVYDDRPEFADPVRFPRAEAVLCGPFTALAEKIKVTPDDYVVIMTRGHQADYEVLTQTRFSYRRTKASKALWSPFWAAAPRPSRPAKRAAN